jgi:hypothetical protein
MTFFYDLNKKLDSIREKPEVTHKQLNERDMSRAAKGYEKYGREGMEALAKAGREGKALDPVRKKYDKYDNKEVDEGVMDTVKSIGKKVASGVNKLVGHGSDEDMRRDVQRKAGAPVTGKKPEQKTTEAAKYRDPKYKDKLYTQEPPDYTYGPDMDDAYDNPKPDDYAGRKRKIGGGEFDHNDPLVKGFGRSGTGSPVEKGPRKGLPTRNQITSLKGSIKAAKGTHAEPNLPEAGAPMSAKQKSFAKLAPPADKITFADKIAGAKKEVDEMLGDVAAEAMRKALGGGKGRNAEMDEEKSKGTAFDMSTPRAAAPKVGSIERGHKHDIKHTATGRMVTRRTDDQGNSVGADDASDTQAGPRGRGRPKGTTGAIGAKGPSGKSKLMTREGEVDIRDQGEYDQEGDMAKDSIKTVVRHAQALEKILGDNDNLPEWVQSKLAKIESMMTAVDDYMQNQEDDEEEPIAEKAVSKQQQKFMGMAHAMQKGEKVKGASKELKKVAKTMKPKDTEDFAKTKHKGLPDKAKSKKKEEDVEESTTSGSVATSSASKGGGSLVGKGIYDSMNRELENMIAESMTINMSNSTEGGKSLTVTATDDDAMKLAMMLKSAGLGGHGDDMHSHGEQPCDTCGMPNCGCGDVQEAVDENSPDYPTNTEQADNNFGYAGGLNKPKTDVAGDGQTTIPNSAVHTQDEDALRRMMEMAGLNNSQLSEGMMDKLKSMLVPKLMKLLGPDAKKIASAVKQATGGDVTPSKENAMKVVQALGINQAATQGQSQMAEGIAGNWQGKLIQALYTLGLLGSAGAAASMWGTMGGSHMAIIGTLLLMFAGAFFGNEPGQAGAMGNFGNKGMSAQRGLDDFGNPVRNMNVDEDDDLSRMMEIAGVKKKPMDEQKTEEGNLFTKGLADDDIEVGEKIPGTNAIKKKDIDESIFALTNQWQAYKG